MATSLAQLNPFGPIFGKELRTTARRKRTYWLRVIYLAALFLFLILGYTSVAYRTYGVSGSVAERARQEAELGLMFFQTFAMFSVVAMPLIAPILTSTAISSERLGRTLNVLLMTPITSWQIVSGKLFSRLLIALTLLALSMPVLAVVRLLGGVELGSMMAVLILCASVALASAALGLLFSTVINRAYAVILMTYLTLGFFYGLLPFMIVLFMEANGIAKSGPPGRWFFNFLSLTNPIFTAGSTVFRRGFRVNSLPWYWCAAFHVGVAALIVPWTGRALRRRVLKEGEPAGPREAAPPAAVPAEPGVSPVAVRRKRKASDVGDNPVLWRELRRPLFVKPWQAKVGALLTVALLGLTYILMANQYSNQLMQAETHIGYAFIIYSLILLLVCVLAGTAISSEKESDTWTLLLATPLTGAEVVGGKVGGILRRAAWPMALFTGHLFIFALVGVLSWTAVLVVIWVTVTFTSVWLALGLFYSLRLKNNTFAVVASLLMPVCAYAGVPVVLLIVGNVLFNSSSDRLAEIVFYYLPYLYMGEAIVGMPGKDVWNWNAPNGDLRFPDHHDGGMTPLTFLGVTFFAGAVHLAVAGGMLWWLARRFDRVVGRAEQSVPFPKAAPTGGMPVILRS